MASGSATDDVDAAMLFTFLSRSPTTSPADVHNGRVAPAPILEGDFEGDVVGHLPPRNAPTTSPWISRPPANPAMSDHSTYAATPIPGRRFEGDVVGHLPPRNAPTTSPWISDAAYPGRRAATATLGTRHFDSDPPETSTKEPQRRSSAVHVRGHQNPSGRPSGSVTKTTDWPLSAGPATSGRAGRPG